MASTNEPSPVLSLEDVARETGTSLSTVRRWISSGELRAYRYGKRVIRVERRDLDRMRKQIAAPTYAHVSGGDGVA